MVQVARGRLQTVGYVAHGVAARELAENHAYELAPCVIALVVLVRSRDTDDSFDVFFWKFADYLRKKCYICHRKLGDW